MHGSGEEERRVPAPSGPAPFQCILQEFPRAWDAFDKADAKIFQTLTFAGALFTAFLFVGFNQLGRIGSLSLPLRLLLVVGFLCMLVGLWCLLAAAWPRKTYGPFELAQVREYMDQEQKLFEKAASESIVDADKRNREVLSRKWCWFRRGMRMNLAGMTAVTIFLVVLVISPTRWSSERRESQMHNAAGSTPTPQPTAPAPGPAPAPSPSPAPPPISPSTFERGGGSGSGPGQPLKK